jgi:hypothetical protein
VSLQNILEGLRPAEKPRAPSEVTREEILSLLPEPSPAEMVSTAAPGARLPTFIMPAMRVGQPPKFEPTEMKAVEEERSLLEANIQSLLRVLKFPVTAGLEVEETLKPLGKEGVAKYIPKPTQATGKWFVEMAKGLALAPVELAATLYQLSDPKKSEIYVIGRGLMPREQISREIVETIPEQAVKVMIGKGMLRRGRAIAKGARMGWRRAPAEAPAEPALPVTEETAFRPLGRLAGAEKEAAIVPETWRRAPLEYELLKRRLRALEEKPAIPFPEGRPPPEILKGRAIHYGRILGEEPVPRTVEVPPELEPWKTRPPAFERRPTILEAELPVLGREKPVKVAPKTPKAPRMEQLGSIDGEVVRVGTKTPRVFHYSYKGWVDYRTKTPASPKLARLLEDFVRPRRIRVAGRPVGPRRPTVPEEPAPVPPRPVAKEPWQMTFEEYINREGALKAREIAREAGKEKEVLQLMRERHLDMVNRAKYGIEPKPVPDEVLAEYPELAKPGEAPAAKAEVTPKESPFREGLEVYIQLPKHQRPHRATIRNVLYDEQGNPWRIQVRYKGSKKGVFYEATLPTAQVEIPSRTLRVREYHEALKQVPAERRGQVKSDAAQFDRTLEENADLWYTMEELERTYEQAKGTRQPAKTQAILEHQILTEMRNRVAEELKIEDIQNPVKRAEALPKLRELIERKRAELEPPEKTEVVAGDLKVGDRVKIQNEWLRVEPSEEAGTIKLTDGRTLELDVFEKLAVEGLEKATPPGAAGAVLQTDLVGKEKVVSKPPPAKQPELGGLQRAEAEAMTAGKMKKVVQEGEITEELPGQTELYGGFPFRPLKTVNQLIRFMDDVASEYITKPLHDRIVKWIEDKAPTAYDFWKEWGATLVKANPDLALFMRRFHGGIEAQKLAVRETGKPLMVEEGQPLTTLYGRRFKAEVVKRRLGQLMAPTTVRPGRQPTAKYWPARPARKLSELTAMTPDQLVEAKARVGKTMTPSEAEGIIRHAKAVEVDLAKRGIKKEEIPIPEAGVTPIPRLGEAVMGARLVEAELGKALYDLGFLNRDVFKQFYGIHLKRMYESVEFAKEGMPRVPGLRVGRAKKLRLKMLRQRGKTAVETERFRWTEEIEKTRKELSGIKIENIRGLGKHMTWRLKDAGYGTLDKLIAATPKELTLNIQGVGKKRAESFKRQAEGFLREKRPGLLKQLRLQRGMKKYAWMRVDLPWEWQKEAGRYMTPEIPYLRGSYATIYNIQTGKLLKDIAHPKFKRKFWDDVESVEFSQRIPETKEGGRYVYGDLAGKHVSKRVLAEIKPFLELPTEANRTLNAWLGLWKMGKVSGGIGTQMRNLYFNVGPLSDFARVGVKDYAEGAREYLKRGERYRDLLKEGYLETDFMRAEVEDALKSFSLTKEQNLGVASAQWTREFLGKAGFNKAVRAYQAVDQMHKMAVYNRNLRLGLPKDQALQEVYKWSQNYREVPQMAHWLRTHATGYVAPFLSFSFEAARFLKNAAIERPITLAKWVTFPFLLRAWAQKRAGLSDREMAQLSKTLPKDVSLYSSLLVPRKEKGKFNLVNLSYAFPWMELYDKIEKPWDIALGSPVFKTTMEAYTGIDSYTGKPILKPEDVNTIDVVQRWGDHLYRQVMPSTAPEIPGLTEGGYEFRRMARVLKAKRDYYGERYPTTPALLHTFAGLPIRKFDLRREVWWRKREIDKEIQTAKARRSALKYNRGLTNKEKLTRWHKLTGKIKELQGRKTALARGVP